METKAAAAVPPDPQSASQPRLESREPRNADAAVPAQPDLRLVIEADSGTGSFVYKAIDRRTGEVVSQLPREEVLRLRGEADYSAGDVVETSA